MRVEVTNAEETRALGRALGTRLTAGDLVMLSGGLGAGKTTFTQGIGAGMGVRGQVASPTFIVARVHPSLTGGPDLIHADAYRIRDLDDLETLDLDSTIDEAVTVVEWGEGKTEAMSETRLEVEVTRARGGEAGIDGTSVDLEGMDDGRRILVFHGHGAKWGPLLTAAIAEAGLVDVDAEPSDGASPRPAGEPVDAPATGPDAGAAHARTSIEE